MDALRHSRAEVMQASDRRAAELYNHVRDSVGRSRASGTRSHTRLLAAALIVPLVTIAIAVAASYATYGRPAAGLLGDVEVTGGAILLLIALTLLALVATSFALARGLNGLGAPSALLIGIAACVTPIYGVLAVLEPLHPGRLAFAGTSISPWGTRCIALAVFVGLLALGAFVSALKQAVPSASSIRALALGAAAGAWAGLAVFLFCPSGDQMHLALGHLMPIAALICAAPAAARILRP